MGSSTISRVTITELVCTCDFAPVQLEGKLSNGWSIYARSRFGRVSVGVAPTMDEAVAISMGGLISHGLYAWTNRAEKYGGYHCVEVDQLRVIAQLYVSIMDWENIT